MPKIFWRSKEGAPPPSNAQFTVYPFVGAPFALRNYPLLSTLPPPSPVIRVVKRADTPNREQWVQICERTLEAIAQGTFKKVVLARQTTLHLSLAPDPFCVAAALEKRAQGATLFCVQFEEGGAFLGATPERLFQKAGQKITCEAMAGTRRLGIPHSAKDLHEFQFVRNHFEEALGPNFQFSEITTHQTATVHHLFSRGTVELAAPLSNDALVQRLHPSPALCGTPKRDALAWISTNEPFKRGLYGGILGWQTEDASDWMVSIRSCALEGAIARLYTGVGVVEGSNPEAEWDELEAKLALYEGVFAWDP